MITPKSIYDNTKSLYGTWKDAIAQATQWIFNQKTSTPSASNTATQASQMMGGIKSPTFQNSAPAQTAPKTPAPSNVRWPSPDGVNGFVDNSKANYSLPGSLSDISGNPGNTPPPAPVAPGQPAPSAPAPSSAPTNTPSPSPASNPAPGSVASIDLSGTYDSEAERVQNEWLRQQQQIAGETPNYEQTYQNQVQKYQAQIDAQNAVYRDMLTKAQTEGQGRIGSNRAIQARSGLLGSDFGSAQSNEINNANSEQYNAIENARKNAIQEILSEAKTSAQAEYDAKIKAKAQGAESLLKYYQEVKPALRAEKSKKVAALLLSKGLNPDTLTDVQLSQAGVTREDIASYYAQGKGEQEKAKAEQELKAQQAQADLEYRQAQTGSVQADAQYKQAQAIAQAVKAGQLYEVGGRIYDSENKYIADSGSVQAALQKPMTIGEGQTLVDPRTGKVIAQGQAKTVNVGEGQTMVDPATGRIIAQGQRKPTILPDGSIALDQNGNVIYENVKTPTVAKWGGGTITTASGQNFTSVADYIRAKEGFRMEAYDDATGRPVPAGQKPRGTMTIGAGATRLNGQPIQPGQRLTQAQADQLLATDMARHSNYAKLVTVPLSEPQKAALASFEFNLGPAVWTVNPTAKNIIKAINAGDFQKASNLLGNSGVGTTGKGIGYMPGLAKRRKEEAQLLLRAGSPAQETPEAVDQPQMVQPEQATWPKNYTDWQLAILAKMEKFPDTPTAVKVLTDAWLSPEDWSKAADGLLPPSNSQYKEAEKMVNDIDKLLAMPGFSNAVGAGMPFGLDYNYDTKNFNNQFATFKNLITLPNLGMLKGPMSNSDLDFIKNSVANLNPSGDEALFIANIREIQDKYKAVLQKRADAQASQQPVVSKAVLDDLLWNQQTTMTPSAPSSGSLLDTYMNY